MIELNSIRVFNNPFPELKEIGVLLFTYYPTTIVCADENDLPVIKEWVDCTTDNKTDRHFYYRTTNNLLKLFIEGSISHLDLINNSTGGVVYFQDTTGEDVSPFYLLQARELPVDYKPSPKFIFNEKDSVDIGLIINYFDLDNLELVNEAVPFIVKEISKREKSETFYIHLEKGKGVGYGTIKTEVLANTLSSIDKLYKNVALDHLKTKDRGEIQIDAKKNEGLTEYTDTEIFGYGIAASFGIMIRPINFQIDMFDKTPALEIAEKILNLITHTKNPEELEGEYTLHSRFTQISYEQFLVEVYKQQLKIDLNWFNPKSQNIISANINYLEANKVLEDIKELSLSNEADIPLVGKFREINCDTAHFIFNSTDGGKYTGRFNDELSETINQINFIDVYRITIHRTIGKEPGKGERVVNTITVCYKDV